MQIIKAGFDHGRQRYKCKLCQKEYHRAHYLAHKDEIYAKTSKYKKEHREYFLSIEREKRLLKSIEKKTPSRKMAKEKQSKEFVEAVLTLSKVSRELQKLEWKCKKPGS